MKKARRSLRLKDFDYSQSAAYFLTNCTHDRGSLFGEIIDGQMLMNACGEIVVDCWNNLSFHDPAIQLDAFVVMPNHVHGIIIILDNRVVGAIHESPLPKNISERRVMLIPKIVGRFKMNSAKRINQLRKTSGMPVWQRNYFEHIIRNEKALGRIRNYIETNPLRWQFDKENPNTILADKFDPWIASFREKPVRE